MCIVQRVLLVKQVTLKRLAKEEPNINRRLSYILALISLSLNPWKSIVVSYPNLTRAQKIMPAIEAFLVSVAGFLSCVQDGKAVSQINPSTLHTSIRLPL